MARNRQTEQYEALWEIYKRSKYAYTELYKAYFNIAVTKLEKTIIGKD